MFHVFSLTKILNKKLDLNKKIFFFVRLPRKELKNLELQFDNTNLICKKKRHNQGFLAQKNKYINQYFEKEIYHNSYDN